MSAYRKNGRKLPVDLAICAGRHSAISGDTVLSNFQPFPYDDQHEGEGRHCCERRVGSGRRNGENVSP